MQLTCMLCKLTCLGTGLNHTYSKYFFPTYFTGFFAVSDTYGILLTCTYATRHLQYFITMLMEFVSSDVCQFKLFMK